MRAMVDLESIVSPPAGGYGWITTALTAGGSVVLVRVLDLFFSARERHEGVKDKVVARDISVGEAWEQYAEKTSARQDREIQRLEAKLADYSKAKHEMAGKLTEVMFQNDELKATIRELTTNVDRLTIERDELRRRLSSLEGRFATLERAATDI